jgi:4-diphosphocytidyl-2-C-methyl-D-erythritol kinase
MVNRSALQHQVLSPAKVNLFLKVVSRRSDGYHNIVSLVDPISLCDVIHIGPEPEGRVVVEDDRGILPQGSGNTMYRAATLLRQSYGPTEGVRIYVEKKIPIGAGLGGPSSNAATVLKALVSLWGLSVPQQELMELGRQVGADVPLFLYGKPCVMRGVGEKITPVRLPFLWYLIVYPEAVISTREVYEGLRMSLTKGENDIKVRSDFDTLAEIASLLENDLEKVGIRMCPAIQAIKDSLIEAGAAGAMMSGSGSSVFGLFEREEDAQRASAFLKDLGSVFVAHSL